MSKSYKTMLAEVRRSYDFDDIDDDEIMEETRMRTSRKQLKRRSEMVPDDTEN